MKFHNVHGTAISLSENRSVATRSENCFCHGVVFSDQTIKVNQKLCLELGLSQSWSGALRVGVTVHNPGKLAQRDLPRYTVPNLAKKEGYWIQPINESFFNQGSKVTLYLSSQGTLQLFVDGEHKGACLTGLPVEKALWVCLDLYGNTKSAKFVKPDDAPKEILARGPEAVQAYEDACTSGTQPVHRTRLMLVGQGGVGKTSLKKALMGQSHDVNEESTDGIDLSASASFNTSNRQHWQMAIKGEGHTEPDSIGEKRKLGIMGGAEGLQEEYYQALAENIAKELLLQKQKQKEFPPIPAQRISKGSSRESSRSSLSRQSKTSEKDKTDPADKSHYIPPEIISEVPHRVVELVQELLEEEGSEVRSSQNLKTESFPTIRRSPMEETVKLEKDTKVVLNIWDFSGRPIYYTTHQVFLTCRAVYIIVFNLCQNLRSAQLVGEGMLEDEMATLDYMDFWMRSVYAHTSQNSSNALDNTRLSPPVFIVGTHRNSLSPDVEQQEQMVENKFEEIRNFIMDKPYAQHIVTPFLAVENNLTEEDNQISTLRKLIENIAGKEPYMGEQIPIKWVWFEKEVASLVEDYHNHASFDQVKEIANNVGIVSDKEVRIMLQFYHDLGVLIYYGGSGTVDNLLRNTVILKPEWLIDMFSRILMAKQSKDKWSMLKDKWRQLEERGILDMVLIDHLWKDVLDQKLVLLGLMEKFDLICSRVPSLSQSQGNSMKSQSYYVPARLSTYKDSNKRPYSPAAGDVVFYIDFNGFLPDGLFHRILTQTVRWCMGNSGKEPYSMFSRVARFYLDQEHDFVLQMMSRRLHRVKVVVMRVTSIDDDTSIDTTENDSSKKVIYPKAQSCAKVRNFLETCLYEIKETWIKRLTYNTYVECTCERPCYLHDLPSCHDETCMHFLNLDECLANRVVCCDHRRVKTTLFQKWFPTALSPAFSGQVLPRINLEDSNGNIEKHNPLLPVWVKSVAKLLNGGEENQDWQALAKIMGYQESKIENITNDLNPALMLLADWILTSGNTALSVDMLIRYLEKINREDIIEIIQKAKETNHDPPQVFISYQWDNQDDVQGMRDQLERAGFSCWMDIGQMGGGDKLNLKIDEGIRNAKVIIACVSPKYTMSQHCNRELSLADLLAKPIIPVMFEQVPWPPPGGMALVFSQLVYIDMKGVGGHGGTGIHADLNDRYKEIVQKLTNYIQPDLTRYFDTETIISSKESPVDNSSLSSVESVDNSYNISLEQASTRALNPSLQRVLVSHDMLAMRPPEQFPPQQVTVTRCGVCTIL